jgi:hypothetical protein
MSENNKSATPWGKIILGCLGVGIVAMIALGGAGYYFFKDMVAMSPEDTARIQEKILPGSELPDGYTAQFGMSMSFLEFDMVVLEGPNHQGIVVMCGPKDTIEQSSRSSRTSIRIDGKRIDERNLKPIGDEVFVIGGKQVTFKKSRMGAGEGDSTSEGADKVHYEGMLIRPDGRAVQIVLVGPEAGFDSETIKKFFASVNFGDKDMPATKAEQPEQAETPKDPAKAPAPVKQKAPK